MPPLSLPAIGPTAATVRIVMLHDDLLSTMHDMEIASSIADEMDLQGQREWRLWDVNQLEAHSNRNAGIDINRADLVVVILRGATCFSSKLQWQLRGWLRRARYRSTALIAALQDCRSSRVDEIRAFLERIAHAAGKDCFSRTTELAPPGSPLLDLEMVWVL